MIIDSPKPHRILESTWCPSDRNVFLYMVHTCSGDIVKVGMSTDSAVRVRDKARKLLASTGQPLSNVHGRAAVQIDTVLRKGLNSMKAPDFERAVGLTLLSLHGSSTSQLAIRTNRTLGLEVLAGHWLYLIYPVGTGSHSIARSVWFSNAKVPGGIMTEEPLWTLIAGIVDRDLAEGSPFADAVAAAGGISGVAVEFELHRR